MGATSGPSGPKQHSSNLGHFSTAQLLSAASEGNPFTAEEFKKRGLNPDGTPIRPEWESQADPSGLLKSQFQVKGDVTPDMRALEAYRSRALGTGPSAWASQALQQQGLEEAGQRSRMGTQAASAAAQARGGLASRQGLSAGASERLGAQNMRDQLFGGQSIAAQGALQRGNIGLQDEQTRQQMLQQLPGMEVQYTQPQFQNKQLQQWNVEKALTEATQKRQNEANIYNEKMRAWAGEKQGEAMRDSGSGGKK